ncbi:MAG: HEAT repeat domain-containing protein [Opitutaceae bacterium]|nr:HEAT repeat domain-containing protein [Opitutaceae bacterium]
MKLKFVAGLVLPAIAAFSAGDPGKTRELLARLQPASPLAERARACQQLAIVGTPEAVPALAVLLADTQLGHYAREALEAMALPEADAALRAALGRLQGAQLVGAINSLGVRGDAAAVPALVKLADGADANSAAAALVGLARIGAPAAIAKVEGALAGSRREAAAEAAIVAADRLLARGQPADAAKLFDAVRASGIPGQSRLSAVRGAILARGAAGVPLLLENLRSAEIASRDLALRTMRELPGAGVTAALVTELPRFSPGLQPLVLAALVERGGEGVLGAVEDQAASADPAVRLAALDALGRIGGPSSLPPLLRALGEEGEAAASARRSLVQLPAPGTDAALLRALASAGTDTQLKLIGVLGDRGAVGAAPALLRLARDPRVEISRAALRALAGAAAPGDLPELIRLAVSLRDDAARTLADRAIHGAAMKILEPEQRVEPLLAALRQSSGPAERAALMRPLGAVVRALGGSAPALEAVRVAAISAENAEREAAVRCLADWPDAAPASDLIALARGNAEPLRGVAFAGAVRLAANVAAGRDKTSVDALHLLTQANALVASDAERMMVVSALGHVRRIEALRLLEPYLQLDAVKTEAALAVVQIAPALLGGANAAAARSTLEKIAASERDAGVRARAAELLRSGAQTKKAKKAKAE